MPHENAEGSSEVGQLKRSLRSLATAGSDQPTLFPDDVIPADQLALEFGRCARVVRGDDESDLSDDQADALTALEQKLVTMFRDGAEFDAELWTDAALRASEHWAEVRALARSALEAFGGRFDGPSEEASERGTVVFRDAGD
jgi:hypothetical protein